MWPFFRPSQPLILAAKDIYLRYPLARDYENWRDLRAASRDFLQPWEPLWPRNDLTRLSFERRLHRYGTDRANDQGYSFFLFREDHVLLGGISLSGVRRGAAQSAMLGYWMGVSFAGKGYMTKGVKALLLHAFGPLVLHRIEAACLPHNIASVRLLEKTGFVREGFARQYLSIAGKWEDHVLYGLVRPEQGTQLHPVNISI
jgi:[ribosomal protein S5]-alanine N-acetyltransferase